MSATVTAWKGTPPSGDELDGLFAEEGLTPHWWANAPGEAYGWHSHPYHKVLYCGEGSITFHTRDEDFELKVGDRLDIPANVEHAATVGHQGCRCIEAPL